MREIVLIESEVTEILSVHREPPAIVRWDGSPLSVNEKQCLVLQPDTYRVQSAGLENLKIYFGEFKSNNAKILFWEVLRKNIRHPMVPFFFIFQGRMVHLLECILEELNQASHLEEGLISMASNALRVGHKQYSMEELEKIGDLITTLMAQAHLSSGYTNFATNHIGEEEIGPEAMRAIRLKRDIYRALGTLQEVVRAALYCKLEIMLADT